MFLMKVHAHAASGSFPPFAPTYATKACFQCPYDPWRGNAAHLKLLQRQLNSEKDLFPTSTCNATGCQARGFQVRLLRQ